LKPASGERTYQSPLRDAQAGMTRERILMAAKDYLERERIESLSLRRVAALSEVSPPTVYAHFPSMDHLVAAFFYWLKPRLDLDKPLPPLAQLPSMPERLFPLYERHGQLLRNLMNQPAWDRQREADRGNRHGGWIEAIGRDLPHLTPVQLRRGALAIASFWTPTHWRWLMDTCRFSPVEAQRVASWGIGALIHALKNDPDGLRLPAAPRSGRR
jgi:AcrR family transcriptional regulator